MAGSHHVTSEQLLVTHSVAPGETGTRLDAYLKYYYSRRSREEIKRAISSGRIRVIREQSPHLHLGKLKPSSQLIAGDEVQVMTPRKPEPPVNFDYKIIFEDEWLFVIEKPAPLPVHPAGRYYFNTLLVHLRTNGFTAPLKANREYYLPHRIDKETSGILVLTKCSESCAALTQQFAARTTEKKYLALVKGHVKKEEFTVNLPLQRDPHSRIKLKMAHIPLEEGGQVAETRFRRLEVRGDFSLVECFPKTGRQHQIRVHLESAGYPIVGDKLYGMPEPAAIPLYDKPESKDADTRAYLTPELEARLILPRHALHAAGIGFLHPSTKMPIRFESPLPEDLRNWFARQPTSTP